MRAGRSIQLSSRSLDLPQPKEGGFRPYRVPCAGRVELSTAGSAAAGGEGQLVALRVRLTLPAAGGEFSWQTEIPLERASSRRDFAGILAEVFAESGDGLLTLARLELDNRTGLPDDALFVPPSALKKARAAFYRALEEALESRRRARLRAVAADARAAPAAPAPAVTGRPQAAAALADLLRRARRQDLSPLHDDGDPAPHPFVGASAVQPEELASIEGFRVLPLPPVARAEDPADWAVQLVQTHPEQRFAVGLSNLSHLELARRLGGRPNVFFFADFPLYTANRFTAAFLARQVPGLLFATHWLEGDGRGRRGSGSGGGPASGPAGSGLSAAPVLRHGLPARTGSLARWAGARGAGTARAASMPP